MHIILDTSDHKHTLLKGLIVGQGTTPSQIANSYGAVFKNLGNPVRADN